MAGAGEARRWRRLVIPQQPPEPALQRPDIHRPGLSHRHRRHPTAVHARPT